MISSSSDSSYLFYIELNNVRVYIYVCVCMHVHVVFVPQLSTFQHPLYAFDTLLLQN